MAERLSKMFSSPKFKENRTYLSKNLNESVSPLLSSSRYNSTQDDLSLEMDAKSEGFTSRICDTANSLLLGEFPWGTDRQGDSLTIKQKRLPKPVPVRLRIGPPNSSTLMSEGDTSEYENEEYNSSRSVIQALREMSRKRVRSLLNEESDSEVDSAAAKKPYRPAECRHNLYLSQLEEETQEYKNGTNCGTQSEHLLERAKRGREDDSNPLLGGIGVQDTAQSKRQRRHAINNDGTNRLDDLVPMVNCNDTNTSAINRALQQAGRNNAINNNNISSSNSPRRGSNEIFSSLSSSLTLLDPAVLYRLIRPSVSKERRRKQKKVVAVETQTLESLEISATSPKERDLESPKKEDKSINTEPEKQRAPIEEKVVTDQMANSLMKSAVRKFMATEDPTLSPVRNPKPIVISKTIDSEKPSTDSSVSKPDLLVPAVSASPFLQTSSIPSTSSITLPPSSDKPILNTSSSGGGGGGGGGTFKFGAPLSSTPNFSSVNNTPSLVTTSVPNTTPKPPLELPTLSFGSPGVVCTTSTQFSSSATTTTSSSFIFTPTTVASTSSNADTKPTDTAKGFSFGDNILGINFKPPESNTVEPPKLETNKKMESPSSDLFKQPTLAFPANIPATLPASTSTSNPTNSTSELGKGTFSFGTFSNSPTSSSVTTASSDTIKTPSFTFGAASIANKPTASSLFGGAGSVETPKTTIKPPKLPLFGTTSTTATIKPAEPTTQVGSGIVNSGGFQFGGASTLDKKPAEKPEENKQQGLFSFGSGSSANVTTTPTAPTSNTAPADNKPFTFGGASTTNKTETTQSVQICKPVFLFGSSSFGTTQANKEPFTFGSKPSGPTTAVPPSFNTPSSGLFGGKPAIPSTSTVAAPTTTTTTGLFGFGAAQPPAAATTAAPTFGSIASTTKSGAIGGFNFQPPKTEEKASTTTTATRGGTGGSSGGFPFKFTGGTGTQSVETPKQSFTFGSSSTQQPATPAFGSASTMPTFGNVTPAAPSFSAFSAPSPAPAFGASPAMPNPAPTFGSTTPAPTFGAPAAQPAPVFGSMQAQQQPQQAPPFTFGASSAPSAGAAGGGFNFGASAAQPPAAPQPSSSGLFQFGSAANQQNPPGSGPAFQFNAAPSTTPQVGGGQPMFSIGSGSTAPRSRQLLRRKK